MIKVIKSVKEMQEYSDNVRKEGKTIALVPTMGFLHEGHLSLVRRANELADITVTSIFVNPTQFAPNEDLASYPKDFVRDRGLLIKNNADVIFYPTPEEIYNDKFQTYVETYNITKVLEGECRPTHFKGVTTIVSMLFNITKPHFAIFGQKDAQQASVIRRMAKDLHFDLEVVVEPIVREKDGLAMSSRNIYLSATERKDALVLSGALNIAREEIEKGVKDVKVFKEKMEAKINSVSSSKLDYVSVVAYDTFEIVETLEVGQEYFILIACYIGSTRLIDNLLIKV